MPANKNTTYPRKPVRPVAPNPLKKGVITRKLNGKMYDIMVRTVTDQVYDKDGKSVTERLADSDQGIAELDARVTVLENQPNIVLTESDEVPEDVKDGDIYYKVSSKDDYPEPTDEENPDNEEGIIVVDDSDSSGEGE